MKKLIMMMGALAVAPWVWAGPYDSLEELGVTEAQACALVAWAKANPAGYSGRMADGGTVSYTADQVRNMGLGAWKDLTETIPAARKRLIEAQVQFKAPPVPPVSASLAPKVAAPQREAMDWSSATRPAASADNMSTADRAVIMNGGPKKRIAEIARRYGLNKQDLLDLGMPSDEALAIRAANSKPASIGKTSAELSAEVEKWNTDARIQKLENERRR